MIEERHKKNLVYEWLKVISTAFLLAFISSTTSNHFYRCTLWNQFPSKNLLVEKGVCFGHSILRKSEIVFSPILQLSVLQSLLLWSKPTNLKTVSTVRDLVQTGECMNPVIFWSKYLLPFLQKQNLGPVSHTVFSGISF